MPWTKLWCPCVGGEVPLDHYSSGSCPAPPMPLEAITAMLDKELNDTLHAGGTLTTSRLTSCPREQIIRDFFDLFLDPRAHDAADDGTALHERLQRYTDPEVYTELRFPVIGAPVPKLFGEPIAGKVDWLSKDYKRLVDYKTHGQGAAYFAARECPTGSEEDQAKMNIYRLMVEQTVGVSPNEMILWHHWRAPGRELPDTIAADDPRIPEWGKSWGKAGPVPSWFMQRVPVRNEKWIASVKPYGGRYTVGEIFDMYQYFAKARAGGVSVEEALGCIPLVGRDMMGGQKCSKYCSPGIRNKCFELAGLSGPGGW